MPPPVLSEQGLPIGYQLKPQYEITPREAAARLAAGKLVLIDVRTQPEWDLVRVPGSVHIPLDDVESRHDEVEAAAGQTIACLCHHGVRSMRAALALRSLGHGNVVSVAGGIDLWSLAAEPALPRYERAAGICRPIA
ncbi:MAG: rhodanese-like domain-containing protein [Phycisphaerales bacterium]